MIVSSQKHLYRKNNTSNLQQNQRAQETAAALDGQNPMTHRGRVWMSQTQDRREWKKA